MKNFKYYMLFLVMGLASTLSTFSCKCEDLCENTTCENGGICNEGICECPEGYIGDNCETLDLPTSGLVAWYPFNENANDESTFGNHGQVFGATLVSDRNGKSGSAYAFDGIDDYIRVPHSGGINFGNGQDFTVSLWIKCGDQTYLSTPDNDVLSKWFKDDGNGTGYPFVVRIKNQNINQHEGWVGGRWDGTCENGGSVNPKNNIRDNKFHHLVFIKKGTVIEAWQDGKLMDSGTDNTICEVKNEAPLIIGARQKNQGPPYKGVIDNIRIYNRALAETEISTLNKE